MLHYKSSGIWISLAAADKHVSLSLSLEGDLNPHGNRTKEDPLTAPRLEALAKNIYNGNLCKYRVSAL